MLREELNGLIDGHVEDVADVLVVEVDVEYLGLEPLSVAALAGQHEVGHELHLDGDCALAFAFLTTSAIGVEAEIGRCEAHLLRKRLGCEKLPYFVPCLDVGHGIGARALADWVLIHELNGAHHLHVALQAEELARTVCNLIELALHRIIENVAHKAALAASAHASHTSHHAKREAHVNALQVVSSSAFHFDIAVRLATGKRQGNGFSTSEEAQSMRGFADRCDAFGWTIIDDLTTQPACLRAYVDKPVGRADDFLVMLHHNNRIAQVAELLQDLDEPLRVATMQADAGLVEDIEAANETAAKRGCKVDALTLATRQAVRWAIKRQVAQADVQEVLQAVLDFREDALRNLLFVLAQLEALHPRQ